MELPTVKDLDDFDHVDCKASDGIYVHAKNNNEISDDTQEGISPRIPGIIDIIPAEVLKRFNLSHMLHREDRSRRVTIAMDMMDQMFLHILIVRL